MAWFIMLEIAAVLVKGPVVACGRSGSELCEVRSQSPFLPFSLFFCLSPDTSWSRGEFQFSSLPTLHLYDFSEPQS